MAKYTRVINEDCLSCAACATVAPDIYDLDEDNRAVVIFKQDGNRGVVAIPEDLYQDLLEAQDTCPMYAVLVSDVPFDQE
ncbi:MAG: ferredoxin [Paenibacillaceae bacterium]|jgi:ferredoxin|nr:ferredoxin [Paenibacillaceae bacterium]